MDKENLKYLKELMSDDKEKICLALDEIKEKGEVKMIPYVFDVYQKFDDKKLRLKILSILRDVKGKEAPEAIINEIVKRRWTEGLSDILSICWQSGLDYSPHIKKFVQFVDKYEMEVQIEALTNIEEFIFNKNAVEADAVRNELKNIAIDSKGKKRELIMSFLDAVK